MNKEPVDRQAQLKSGMSKIATSTGSAASKVAAMSKAKYNDYQEKKIDKAIEKAGPQLCSDADLVG